MPDGEHLLCKLVPKNRGEEPAANLKPTGPNIQESTGNKSPTRTYQDLLQNPYDEALFEYYTKTQLAIIGVGGTTTLVDKPQIITNVSPSPSGEHILANNSQKTV